MFEYSTKKKARKRNFFHAQQTFNSHQIDRNVFLCFQFLRLLHFDRFQIFLCLEILKDFRSVFFLPHFFSTVCAKTQTKKKHEKLFPCYEHFYRAKRKLKQCKSEAIASIKQTFVHSIFSRGFTTRMSRKKKITAKWFKKATRDKQFFVARKKKRFLFSCLF